MVVENFISRTKNNVLESYNKKIKANNSTD